MNTPGIDPKLQAAIRRHLEDSNWPELAKALGITLKSVQYNLNAELGRDVTINFVGLLAVYLPATWHTITKEFFNGR